MKRRIHIILLEGNHGWANILNQIGASWSIGMPGRLTTSDASCIIINREPNKDEVNQIQSFINNSGTAVDTNGVLFGKIPTSVRLTELKPYKERSLLSGSIGTIYLRNRTNAVDNSSLLEGAIAFNPEKRIAFWGIDITQFYEDFEKSQRTFPHSNLPSILERTARCSSGEVSKLLLFILIRLHQEAGLPFIRKWSNKDDEKMPATFRVDYDFGKDEHVLPLAELLRDSQVPATWFLHTEAVSEAAKMVLKNTPGFELTLHCHRHIEFKKAEGYQSDIQDGLSKLKEDGITVTGYAAPYGNWTPVLRQAIESFNFSYSSEFCYDYDSKPSIPPESKTLQIPIHPVSIGSLRRFNFSSKMILHYFEEIIDLKKLRFDSLHLYHHPNDQHTEVLKELFDYAKSNDFRFMSYSEFAENWKLIIKQEAFFYYSNDQLKLDYPYTAAIHTDDSIAVTGEKQISVNDLNFVSFADQNCAELIRKRELNQTLSNFERFKYGFLAWKWRNKA